MAYTIVPKNVTDAATLAVDSRDSGRLFLMPDLTADCAITLPSPKAGLMFEFAYKGVAADAQDWNFDTGSDTNYFVGGVVHLDDDAGSGGDEVVHIAPDGNSNSKLNVLVPDVGTKIRFVAIDDTNWFVDGFVCGATAPTFADQ